MATSEYLDRYIAAGKTYNELPSRFKVTTSEDDWRRK